MEKSKETFAKEDDLKKETNKYNKNFLLVLETVKSYDHLFNEYEKSLMNAYTNKLSLSAQTILARLMLRKRKWFT